MSFGWLVGWFWQSEALSRSLFPGCATELPPQVQRGSDSHREEEEEGGRRQRSAAGPIDAVSRLLRNSVCFWLPGAGAFRKSFATDIVRTAVPAPGAAHVVTCRDTRGVSTHCFPYGNLSFSL